MASITPDHTNRLHWPVLTQYDQQHLAHIALPLGGIGTGTVSLGGRGNLRDWEIVNRAAKGFVPIVGRVAPHFALWARPLGGEAVARVLEGAIPASEYEGASGCETPNHGLPHFRHATFAAAYPCGQVLLDDPAVPVQVRLEAFTPLIPGDEDASGLPVVVLRYVLTNPTATDVEASVCGSLPNFIGNDGVTMLAKTNRNRFRNGKGVWGIGMATEGVDPNAETWGTLALATTSAQGITARTAWLQASWGNSLLDFWDDLLADGALEEREIDGADQPIGSLAVSLMVPAGESRAVTFLLGWHFPNRTTWTLQNADAAPACTCATGACANPNWIGNYYTTRFADAWAAVEYTAAHLPRLEEETLAFLRAFCAADLPATVKEAALFNLSTLRSQTCFRTADGHFFGFEGCSDNYGCCHGSCTHVWNYEHATGFLFGALARDMRVVEFLHATRDDGLMSFRVNLPIAHATEWGIAAADGQMGTLMRLYREWQLSGDDDFLRALWPRARKALEFCWIPNGWDGDQDGVMEGCQHNTMDVEYYGPNPQMTGWYLGALRACEEMARHLGETKFSTRCRQLFDSGSRWMDAHLFNGEYYEQEVCPPMRAENIAPGLRHPSMGSADFVDVILQLGAGCLVDQLVGQYTAHVCGLGYLHDPDHVRATLAAILRYNHRDEFYPHFNHLRSYVMNEEAALLMASYPRGRRPRQPFPYYNEVMTGFEYTAAIGMLYEGMTADGLRCIADIRARYDGQKRSPFDEAECGHHYARAMASWAAVLALTGFHYSGVEQSITFAAADAPTQWFWSNGSAWGTIEQQPGADGIAVTLTVLHGTLILRKLALSGYGEVHFETAKQITAGGEIACNVLPGRLS